jgi:hypothetical protein
MAQATAREHLMGRTASVIDNRAQCAPHLQSFEDSQEHALIAQLTDPISTDNLGGGLVIREIGRLCGLILRPKEKYVEVSSLKT